MRRSLSRVWTLEEDARLRQMAAGGASKIRIAAALKRGAEPVQRRATKLGIAIRRITACSLDVPHRNGLRRDDRLRTALGTGDRDFSQQFPHRGRVCSSG